MPIVIFIHIIQGDSLSPRRTTFELLVLDVNTGVNNVDIHTLATVGVKLVLVKGAECELGTVADASETLVIKFW